MPGFVRARLLLPIDDEIGRGTRIEDGYVLWRALDPATGAGDAIVEVGAFSDDIGARLLHSYGPELDVLGRSGEGPPPSTLEDLVQLDAVILPGFVKAHGHDHEPPIIGLARDVPLTAWLDAAVNPFTGFMAERGDELKATLGRSPQSVSYLKAQLDNLQYGITTAMVHHCNYSKYFADDLVSAAQTAGTRLLAAIGSQDRHYYEAILDTPEQACARLSAYHGRHGDQARVAILPGPDQLFSNGPEMMTAQKAWAREHGTLLHCHSSEEKGTTAFFVKTYGTTPVQYAHGLGILDEHTVLAHQVHSTERDLEILADTGARVVHNPLANTILGSGMPAVIDMLERGIPVAISTDGSGSADNQNILAAARLASQYQKAHLCQAEVLPAQKVLEMITIDAAAILGVDAGSLAPGKAADLVVVGLDRPNMVPTRACNVVENLIWASDGAEVRFVVGGGRLLRAEGHFATLDAERILADVTALSSAFDAWRAEAPALKGTGAHA